MEVQGRAVLTNFFSTFLRLWISFCFQKVTVLYRCFLFNLERVIILLNLLG